MSGVIRVVIVRFDDGGWAAYFCTDAQVDVRDILETIAARWAIEEHFQDVKKTTARWRARNGLGRLADNAVDFLYPLVDAGQLSDSSL